MFYLRGRVISGEDEDWFCLFLRIIAYRVRSTQKISDGVDACKDVTRPAGYGLMLAGIRGRGLRDASAARLMDSKSRPPFSPNKSHIPDGDFPTKQSQIISQLAIKQYQWRSPLSPPVHLRKSHLH